MEIEELGGRLRARRAAGGRTIASVAADAGLSVPYIANLENGRGNPTLSAIASLASALGTKLRIDLVEDEHEGGPGLPSSLVEFAQGPRFRAEARQLPPAARERLLSAMAGLGALAGRPLSDLDWHRVLDTVVLLNRGTPAG
ncbi:transcriptional regulator with XRE-family HTH domain [Hamadaea flava]|uniref:Helix-turn-helix domain-containing protein n=1 Tax=Hamadaea flava TaxID=1742688 RepID=A0ABV8LNT2_9ACTN|nr:helix-turn-helix domain-containing protein [Hamadaea flava]MCP2322718.1 transcriptional regulator with XRE-family HTH domain [Hamadaea flava]